MPNNLASADVPDHQRRLEIKTIWGSSVVDTVSATIEPKITLADLPTWVIAEHDGGEGTHYTIQLPPGATGRIERQSGTIHLDGALAEYPLAAAETLYLGVDKLTLQIRYVRSVRLSPPGLWADLNYTWVNTLVLASFLHALAIVGFVATPRVSGSLSEDLYKARGAWVSILLAPQPKNPGPTLLSQLKAKGPEGAAGHESSEGHKKMAVKGDRSEIARGALKALFGKGDRTELIGGGGLGGELRAALGGVRGVEIGDASGLGGRGPRGDGPGGGGLSMHDVGIGLLRTPGHDQRGYGDHAAEIRKAPERDDPILGSPTIIGSLDKEIIREVIKQHLNQIRFCYERELVRSPGLYGKVATRFTIGSDGLVSRAIVTESTLKNDEVERCITTKIRTWAFPKPNGGGIVEVKYPFIFKTSG